MGEATRLLGTTDGTYWCGRKPLFPALLVQRELLSSFVASPPPLDVPSAPVPGSTARLEQFRLLLFEWGLWVGEKQRLLEQRANCRLQSTSVCPCNALLKYRCRRVRFQPVLTANPEERVRKETCFRLFRSHFRDSGVAYVATTTLSLVEQSNRPIFVTFLPLLPVFSPL